MTPQSLLLQNGRFFLDGQFSACDLRVVGSTIAEIGPSLSPGKREIVVPLNGLCAIPGLINSHDHLEFNLFPHLGRPPYSNYVEWSEDIQKNCENEIREVLRVPLRLRLQWGAYKNIFSGVTTVIHHNPFYFQFRLNYPINVFRDYVWIHSLKLEKRDLEKLLTSGKKKVFIHLAEGIDAASASEFSEFVNLGGLSAGTVIVHGVALRDENIAEIQKAGAAVVWCPSSNQYLFGRTAPVDDMAGRIPVFLGTDSTLTGSSNLLEELSFAQRLSHFLPMDILKMVTESPARFLGLPCGELRVGAKADIVIYDPGPTEPLERFVKLSPVDLVCVLRNGKPIFGDLEFVKALRPSVPLHQIVAFREKQKFVTGNFPALIRKTLVYAPGLHSGLPIPL